MAKKKRSKIQSSKTQAQQDDSVRLGALFGVEPARYLPIFFLLLCLALAFVLFVLPGVLQNGTEYRIVSNVDSAELRLNDRRVAVSSSTRSSNTQFVPQGSQRISLSKYGFLEQGLQVDVQGRILFSLFAPRRQEVRIQLPPDPQVSASQFRRATVLEIASWGFVDFADVNATSPVPPLYDSYALDYLARNAGEGPPAVAARASSSTAATSPNVDNEFHAVSRLISSDRSLGDLLRGTARIRSGARIPSAAGITRLMSDLLYAHSAQPANLQDAYEAWRRSGELLQSVRRYSNTEEAAHFGSTALDGVHAAHTRSAEEQGVDILALRATLTQSLQALGYNGDLLPIAANDLPDTGQHSEHARPLLVMDSPVNYALFQSFMNAVPLWSYENAFKLEGLGLSTGNLFLRDPLGQEFNTSADSAARQLNLLAIASFVVWLQEEVQDLGAPRLRLPLPSELSAFDTELSHNSGGSSGALPRIFEGDHWEYSAQYAHSAQEAGLDQELLLIDYRELVQAYTSVINEETGATFEQGLLSAFVQLQNSQGETGILPANSVSPASSFRLIFYQ